MASSDKPTITLLARTPRSADDLPPDIGGTPVALFDMPDPKITAFTRSQLQRMTPEQYAEHAEAIALAQQHNLIVDDVTPPAVLEARDRASRASADKMLKAIAIRDTRKAADAAFKEYQDAQLAFEQAKRVDPDSAATYGLERKVGELSQAWETANQAQKDAAATTA